MVKLLILAQLWGVPVASLHEAGRVLLFKKCKYCDEVNQILRLTHKIGANKAEKYIKEVIEAKKNQDSEKLERIKYEVERI